MKSILKYIISVTTCLFVLSCGSFGGISHRNDIQTFEVRKFENKSETVEIGLDTRFSNGLEDFIFDQSNLNFVTEKADIIYEGEIIQFKITSNSNGDAPNPLENRLTIAVRLRFTDTKNAENNLVKEFSSYYNYDNELTLTDVEEEAYPEIFKKIHQDIIKETISKW